MARGDSWWRLLLCKILSLLCQNAPVLLHAPLSGCLPLAFCAAPALPSFSSQPSHLPPTWNPIYLIDSNVCHSLEWIIYLYVWNSTPPSSFFFSISLLYVTLSCETRSQDTAAAGTIGSVPGSSVAVSWCLPGSLLKALANYCSRCHCLPAFSLRSWQGVICPRPQSYWMAGISRSEGEFPSLNDNWLQAACEGFMARIQGELRESWAW